MRLHDHPRHQAGVKAFSSRACSASGKGSILFFLQQAGLPAGLSPKTLKEINVRAARNFSLVSRIVAAAIAKGIYRSHEPREVVDLLWSLFLGLVHLSDTHQNLGVTISPG